MTSVGDTYASLDEQKWKLATLKSINHIKCNENAQFIKTWSRGKASYSQFIFKKEDVNDGNSIKSSNKGLTFWKQYISHTTI